MSDKEARTPESALQRLTEAGEIQAALERIAELEAASRRIIAAADAYTTIHACDGDDIARMIEYGDAFRDARAALAGEAKAAPRLTDAEVIALRSEFGWAKDTIRAIEAKVRSTT